ncbi:hypothetical protein [Sphingopyxis sp. PET50]|uniref:hypothetical protein n=1 Tax=Sphingopyxis sp. PET50 TaxID=2976533 RepID=UPI0021AE46FB|nr:hypothetical protein [Sphingopyxis sp. PET50]
MLADVAALEQIDDGIARNDARDRKEQQKDDRLDHRDRTRHAFHADETEQHDHRDGIEHHRIAESDHCPPARKAQDRAIGAANEEDRQPARQRDHRCEPHRRVEDHPLADAERKGDEHGGDAQHRVGDDQDCALFAASERDKRRQDRQYACFDRSPDARQDHAATLSPVFRKRRARPSSTSAVSMPLR